MDAELKHLKPAGNGSHKRKAELKHLKPAGNGSHKRKAEPLTQEQEELLLVKGILGDHSPKALLNSVFYFNGICFALRSGDEHRCLRYRDSQIQAFENPESVLALSILKILQKTTRGA